MNFVRFFHILVTLTVIVAPITSSLGQEDSLHFGPGQPVQIDTLFHSSWHKAADFDGDGHLDLVYDKYSGYGLVFCRNDGSGNFRVMSQLDHLEEHVRLISNLSVGDYSGDGKLDVAAIYADEADSSYYVALLEQLDDWNFQPGNRLELPWDFDRIELVDIDNDGKSDIAVMNEEGYVISFYHSDGGGVFSFQETIQTLGYKRIFFNDIDDDGDFDFLTSGDLGIHWYEHEDNNFDFRPTVILNNADFNIVNIVDLNDDQLNDILVRYKESSVRCIFQQTESNDQFLLAPWQLTPYVFHDVVRATAVDINGDGEKDIVTVFRVPGPWWFPVPTYELAWYERDGEWIADNPHPIYDKSFGFFDLYSEFSVGDIDNDGNEDIFGYMENYPMWLKNYGDGRLLDYHSVAIKLRSAHVANVLDFNGDNTLDVLIGFRTGSDPVISYDQINRNRNQLNGSFDNGSKLVDGNSGPILSGGFPLILEDIDGNGHDDIINFMSDSLSEMIVWHGNFGNGQFDPPELIGRIYGKGFMDAEDIDLDGDIDVVAWREEPDPQDNYEGEDEGLVWFENLGNSFGSANYFADGVEDAMIKIGLVNDDEFMDVITFDRQKLIGLINDGSQNFATHEIPYNHQVNVNHSETPEFVDVDLDGLLDIVGIGYGLDSLDSNEVHVVYYENLGLDSIWDYQILRTQSGHKDQSFVVTDIDKDDDFDVLSITRYQSEIYWSENDSDGLFLPARRILTVPEGLNYISVADLNADEMPDLIVGRDYHHRINWYENLTGTLTSAISHEAEGNSFKAFIYPNPAQKEIFVIVECEDDLIYDLELTQLSGQAIGRWKNLINSNMSISIKSLPSGVYLVVLRDNSDNSLLNTLKFIKQ